MIAEQTEAVAPADLAVAAPPLRGVLQKIFSFPAVLGALLIVVTVFTARGRFSDPDMWWHLKTGELIWNTRHIPQVDPFSFSAAGHAWIAQEWLSQLTIYAAYKFGGYPGMMLWLCILTSLVVFAGYALCWLYSKNPKIGFLGAMGVWYFATIGFSLRPQLIGYFFLLCELLILHLGRTRNPRWFFALPPLFALWINCHSSFIFGLIVLGAVLFCSFLNFRAGLLLSPRWEKQSRNTLAAAFALSLAALFLNPIGPELIWYPLDVMFHQHLNLGLITEWQPPSFDDPRTWTLLALAALVLLLPLLRRTELVLEELLLVALGFVLAIQHARMLFVFGILTAPVLCRFFSDMWVRDESTGERVVPNAVLIALAAAAVILVFPSSRNLKVQIGKANPAKALAFIKHSGLSGRILNEYTYGGYLIWADPGRKVFIDGRADLYEPAGVLADYTRFITLIADPRSILDKYRIGLCLLAQNDPASRVLPLIGWKKVYSDRQSAVFARQH